ncbi:MAG: Bug family tripartite tricarboxylate transporter substrate binding protein [Xanthobacteraceae bacterium]
MTLARRKFLRIAASAAALSGIAPAASAQNYPARPLRLIVGYPAGGSTDLVARLMGAWLTDRLGQSVVIENRPGAGTNLAVQAVVASPPDGYTLLFVATTNAINASFHSTLPFDFLRDLAPVAGLVELPFVMEVNPSLPANTVAEFIAHAKANPGKINAASFGTGTVSHMAWELFKLMASVEMVHVPYHGGAPMVTDLIGGRVQAGIDALPNSLPHIRSGALRALAMTGPARSAALPDVPTVGETVAGYEVSGWTGIAVPAGTPAAIVAALHREINAGLSDPRIAARLAEVGGRPILVTAEQFGAMWQRDTDKWAKVVKFAAGKRE